MTTSSLCVLIWLYSFFGWAFKSLSLFWFWFCCCKSPARGYVNTVTDTQSVIVSHRSKPNRRAATAAAAPSNEKWSVVWSLPLFPFLPLSYVSLPLIIMELFMAANVGEIMRGERSDFSALFNIKAQNISKQNQTIFCCCFCWSVWWVWWEFVRSDLICLFLLSFFYKRQFFLFFPAFNAFNSTSASICFCWPKSIVCQSKDAAFGCWRGYYSQTVLSLPFPFPSFLLCLY